MSALLLLSAVGHNHAMTATIPGSQPQPLPGQPARQNGLALASLILGIVGFVANPLLITSLLALIFGIIGLRRAPALGRRTMAIVGIVLAVVSAVVGIVVFSLFITGIGHAVSTAAESAPSTAVSVPVASAAPASSAAQASAAPSKPAAAVPVEYTSALAQAQTYSDNLHLSKTGIYDQLTSKYGGQFPKKAAKYAVAHVKADFNQNALEQAKTYQSNLHLSRSALHAQLTSKYGGKFTSAQADYALAHLPK